MQRWTFFIVAYFLRRFLSDRLNGGLFFLKISFFRFFMTAVWKIFCIKKAPFPAGSPAEREPSAKVPEGLIYFRRGVQSFGYLQKTQYRRSGCVFFHAQEPPVAGRAQVYC